jgi:predicted nucleic acid-binding Zn ribbon protein
MKRFCSQCGKELERNILICPKCGFKNKKKRNKKKLIIPLIVLLILVILGGTGYFFKDKLISFIGNPLDIIAQLQDPDYETKQNFKEKYELYLLELNHYKATMAFPLNQENANDYEAVDYKVDGSTNLTTLELYNQGSTIWNEMEDKNCFREFNINSDCDQLRNKILNIDYELSMKIFNKQQEYRFCGSDKFEHFVPTCKAALNWEYRYSETQCQSCNDRIQELLTLSSSSKNPDLVEALLNLAIALEQYNEASLGFVKANREIEQWKVAEASNQNNLWIVNSLSPTELKKEYEERDEIEKVFLQNVPITKTSLTNHYNENLSRIYPQLEASFDKRSAYSEALDELTKSITSYISVLNGAFSLNLSKPIN